MLSKSSLLLVWLSISFFNLLLVHGISNDDANNKDVTGINITSIHPAQVDRLVVGDTTTVRINYTCNYNPQTRLILQAVIEDTFLADVIENAHVSIACDDRNIATNSTHVKLRGKFLGRTKMRLRAFDPSDVTRKHVDVITDYKVSVIRRVDFVNAIFIVTIIVFIIVLNVGYGCSVELEVVKEILKAPIPPAIGFACQCVLMPLVSNSLLFLYK